MAISHVDYINLKKELIQELKEEFSFDTIGSLAGNNMTQCQGIGLNQEQVIRVKNSWGLPPHALESLAKHWSVSAQLNIH